MEETILISYLNDFIFCPVSIYFHKLYGNLDRTLYQDSYQREGTNAHKTIEARTYSTSKNFLQGIEVYSEKYNIIGKIDIFDIKKGLLTERKNKISKIYEGFVFQLYAQYYALTEMGIAVKRMRLYSMLDNKTYDVELPIKDKEMKAKFEKLLKDIRIFNMGEFKQENIEKCKKCIYEPSCDRSLIC